MQYFAGGGAGHILLRNLLEGAWTLKAGKVLPAPTAQTDFVKGHVLV